MGRSRVERLIGELDRSNRPHLILDEQADRRLHDEIDAYEASLAQMRRARRLTQVQLAQTLRISQPEVSRIERQTDLLMSTLRSYVVAMGGELQGFRARFPEAIDAVLLDLSALAEPS